ncbi:nectin-1-like isoform X2 [Rhinoderma darwinii]|uniref:nectin-1-like isoform X2 n=1 Tax=Rhinoderma darwinii TaxID=43563 RepID=UPI003F67BF01
MTRVRVHEVVYAWLNLHVTLECRIDTKEEIDQITWEMQRNGTSRTFLTYSNSTGPIYQMPYRHRVTFKGDGYKDGSIRIFNVTLADEGIFKCAFSRFPSGTVEGKISLEVFVLPTVRQELKQDVSTPCVNMVTECLVSSAKPPAEIQWITYGINYTSKDFTIIHSNKTMSRRSQLYMTSTPELYGRQVLCLVYQPKIPFEYQENITINDTLTNIQFPPQMVQIEVLKNDEKPVQLLCKSDANPRPKYNWKRKNKEENKVMPLDMYQGTSATLNITDTVKDGLYICEASNTVGINTGYFYLYISKSSARYHLGIFVSMVPSCVIILVSAIFWCFRKKFRYTAVKEEPQEINLRLHETEPEEDIRRTPGFADTDPTNRKSHSSRSAVIPAHHKLRIRSLSL